MRNRPRKSRRRAGRSNGIARGSSRKRREGRAGCLPLSRIIGTRPTGSSERKVGEASALGVTQRGGDELQPPLLSGGITAPIGLTVVCCAQRLCPRRMPVDALLYSMRQLLSGRPAHGLELSRQRPRRKDDDIVVALLVPKEVLGELGRAAHHRPLPLRCDRDCERGKAISAARPFHLQCPGKRDLGGDPCVFRGVGNRVDATKERPFELRGVCPNVDPRVGSRMPRYGDDGQGG
jgi:hypothetical protein